MRILIVEDQPKIGAALQRGLAGEGHAAEHALTGEDGFSRAVEDDFDVVLMDAMLPDADGPDLCRRLRAAGTRATLVVITALPAPARAEIESDPAIDAVLAKPFEIADVFALLTRLNGRSTRRELLTRGACTFDFEAGELRGPCGRARFSDKEQELLRVLVDADGRAVPAAVLAREAWGLEPTEAAQALGVYAQRLARKLDSVTIEPGALRTSEDGALALELG